MKKPISIMTLLSGVLTLLLAGNVQAQNFSTDSLSWTVDHLSDISASSESDYSCVFKTDSTGQISWNQKNNFNTLLKVNSTTGAWSDVSQSGSVVCYVTLEGMDGKLSFARDVSGVSILLECKAAKIRHRYRVSQVTDR